MEVAGEPSDHAQPVRMPVRQTVGRQPSPIDRGVDRDDAESPSLEVVNELDEEEFGSVESEPDRSPNLSPSARTVMAYFLATPCISFAFSAAHPLSLFLWQLRQAKSRVTNPPSANLPSLENIVASAAVFILKICVLISPSNSLIFTADLEARGM